MRARIVIAVIAVVVPVASSQSADSPSRFIPPLAVRVVAFSPDSQIVVAGFGGNDRAGGAAAWEVATGKPLWRFSGAGVNSVSFALDGLSIAIVHGTKSALRLSALTGQQLGEVGPHPNIVNSVAFVSGTGHLATASDEVIRLWDVKSGKIVRELAGGHPKEVQSLVVSPTGKWLVSTGPDTTRIWDLTTGVELKGIIRQDRIIGYYGIVFVGQDRLMMADNSGKQAVRELPSGKVLLRFQSAGGYRLSAYSETASLAAFAGYSLPEAVIADLTFRAPTAEEKAKIDKLLKDFDNDSYDVREAATVAMRAIGSIAEPALQAAATDGPSAEVRMRARETRQAILDDPLRRLTGHTGAVTAMAFSPNGKTFATGGEDGTIRLWDPRTGKELRRLDVSNSADHLNH